MSIFKATILSVIIYYHYYYCYPFLISLIATWMLPLTSQGPFAACLLWRNTSFDSITNNKIKTKLNRNGFQLNGEHFSNKCGKEKTKQIKIDRKKNAKFKCHKMWKEKKTVLTTSNIRLSIWFWKCLGNMDNDYKQH